MWHELNPREPALASWSHREPRTRQKIEEIVIFVRLERYTRGMACGPKALRKHIEESLYVHPLPSERTIARILASNGLTHGHTGLYEGEQEN